MEREETLISDNEGNHLLVALDFYDEDYKFAVLNIPSEFADIEIADISIEKDILDKPIGYKAFADMCGWLATRFANHRNVIITFICSIDELVTNHTTVSPQKYRWDLFDLLYKRMVSQKIITNVNIQDVIIGPKGFQTYGRAFYRDIHAPIVHLIVAHLTSKYSDD
ncbi:MAG: hypothetical protein K1V86_09305 [Duncaniella sp.]